MRLSLSLYLRLGLVMIFIILEFQVNCDFYYISVNSKLKINVEAFIITSVIMTGIIVDVGFALLTDWTVDSKSPTCLSPVLP